MSLARDAATSQVNTVPSGSNHGDSIGKSYAQVQRAESSEVDCKQLQEAEQTRQCHLLSRQPFYLKEAQNTERRVYGMKPLQEIMTGELTDIDNQLKSTNKLLNSTNHLETNTIEPSKSGTRLEEGKEKKGTQQVHLIR
ncbi:hypothetical protein L915_18179 [Phytophthora nicotianae]|uniref:Uncharacterized protein n=1 Tax=Phytophthora nicotianae TaxID=4792 RepID=W2FWW4_PHYNI|nr:hypothetical protein L915_18179 [Phytophthora nicotianae]